MILTGFLFAIGATLGTLLTWVTISKIEQMYSDWQYKKRWDAIKKKENEK